MKFYFIRTVLLFFLFCLPMVYCLLEGNRLKNYPFFRSGKLDQKVAPLMGAEEFLRGRQSLVGRKLHLGAWHGFHEIKGSQFFDEFELDFSFNLDSEAVFNFYLVTEDLEGVGVRLFENKKEEDFAFTLEGQFFSEKKVLNRRKIDHLWNKMNVVKNEKGLHIKLNGEFLFTKNVYDKKVTFAFRSEGENVAIDKIKLLTKKGFGLEESFFPKFSNISYISLLVKILFLGTFVFFIFYYSKKYFGKKRGFFQLMFLVVIFVIGSSLVFVNEYFAIQRYPEVRLEEQGLFRVEFDRIKKSKKADFVFLGSSQTFGEGASQENKVWANKVCRLLRLQNLSCVNLSVRSARVGDFLSVYNEILDLKVKYTIFVLNFNDGETFEYLKNMDKLLEKNKKNNIQSLFVLEPYHHRNIEELETHKIARLLAEKYQIPLLDMNKKIYSYKDGGFLWWDRIHLTDYGHEIMYSYVLKFLRARVFGFN